MPAKIKPGKDTTGALVFDGGGGRREIGILPLSWGQAMYLIKMQPHSVKLPSVDRNRWWFYENRRY